MKNIIETIHIMLKSATLVQGFLAFALFPVVEEEIVVDVIPGDVGVVVVVGSTQDAYNSRSGV